MIKATSSVIGQHLMDDHIRNFHIKLASVADVR